MEFYYLGCDVKRGYAYIKTVREKDLFKWEKCPECNRIISNSISFSFSAELSTHKFLSDSLCFTPDPSMIVISEKALRAFEMEHITGYIPHRIRLFRKDSEISDIYYCLEIIGKGQPDYERMGTKIVGKCEKCGIKFYENKKNIYPVTYLIEDTLDGSDIFDYRYCSKNVLMAVYKHRLTGFYFKEGKNAANSLNFDYIDLKEMFTPSGKRNSEKGNANG